jgi:hypothetical protein
VKDGSLVLQLHSFDVEHHHGPIGNRAGKPYGNGVLLWFEVDDFDAVVQRAAEMRVKLVLPRRRNPPDGDGGANHWEYWMRDPDGCTVVIARPMEPLTVAGAPPRYKNSRAKLEAVAEGIGGSQSRSATERL